MPTAPVGIPNRRSARPRTEVALDNLPRLVAGGRGRDFNVHAVLARRLLALHLLYWSRAGDAHAAGRTQQAGYHDEDGREMTLSAFHDGLTVVSAAVDGRGPEGGDVRARGAGASRPSSLAPPGPTRSRGTNGSGEVSRIAPAFRGRVSRN